MSETTDDPSAESSEAGENSGDHDGEDDPLATRTENYVQILDPEGDEDSEELVPVLWGRFWGTRDADSVAFYWSFKQELFQESDPFEDQRDPHEEGEKDDNGPEDGENEDVTSEEEDLFSNELYAVFGDTAKLEPYDPALRRGEFRTRLLDYTVDETPIPQVMLKDLTSTISAYLEKPKVVWLRDFIESENHSDLNAWFSRLLEEFDGDNEYRYELRAQLIDPRNDSITVKGPSSVDESESDEASEGEKSVRTLDVSLMTDPSNGTIPRDLSEGMEVVYRIVGNVDFLPEKLIDRERQEPASTPMTGPVVSIERNPDIPEDRDAKPENYSRVEVEIEPEIHGEGLAFKDDRIKVPLEEDESEDTATRDLIFLGILLGLLLIIGLLILSL